MHILTHIYAYTLHTSSHIHTCTHESCIEAHNAHTHAQTQPNNDAETTARIQTRTHTDTCTHESSIEAHTHAHTHSHTHIHFDTHTSTHKSRIEAHTAHTHAQTQPNNDDAEATARDNKVLKDELDALKPHLTAVEISLKDQTEQNKTLMQELEALKAELVQAYASAQEALAFKADVEATNASSKKQSGINQALRDEIQVLQMKLAAMVSEHQYKILMVYIQDTFRHTAYDICHAGAAAACGYSV
jgi:hypothetical protein